MRYRRLVLTAGACAAISQLVGCSEPLTNAGTGLAVQERADCSPLWYRFAGS